jgi:transposase
LEGTVDNVLEDMSRKAEPAYRAIQSRIAKSEVVGSDESGCRVNGKKHWFHVWQTKFLTFLVAFNTRGHQVIEEYFPTLIKRLIKHRESIFLFFTHPDIPADNNASERSIRNVKVKTKVSGQFRNKEGKGADRFARLRSVIDTSIKNKQDVYDALRILAAC